MPTKILFINDNPNPQLQMLGAALAEHFDVDRQLPTNQAAAMARIDALLDSGIQASDLVLLVDHHCPQLDDGNAIMAYGLSKGAKVIAMSAQPGPALNLLPGVVDAYGLYTAADLKAKIDQLQEPSN